jgi:hypothetical protein
VGVAQINTQKLREYASLKDYRDRITVYHAVIRETIGHHLPGPGQRNMASDHKDPTTHPRFNHRSGPNSAAKKEVIVRDRSGVAQQYTLSRDSDLICHRQISQWLITKMPGKPALYAITPSTKSEQSAPTLKMIGTFNAETLAAHYHLLDKKPKVIVYVHGSF